MTNPRAVAEPSACRHCGIPHREHYQQWTQAAGWHQWQPPTDAQILARMQARRAGRRAPEQQPNPAHLLVELHLTDTPFRAALERAAHTITEES
ncbi:hypothetical protein LN042_11525 [Kitasatospora sp. RB6PN24]|uniref:hypothetical protein n=1 Tax=Kitasatospora humi TaxID=2893891 RepID=UPI001E5270C0|nr:hypothetical protein [Kitasatospora humi]MCC9307719.1 hypothetical protein [Kitasatospora humi]